MIVFQQEVFDYKTHESYSFYITFFTPVDTLSTHALSFVLEYLFRIVLWLRGGENQIQFQFKKPFNYM